MNYALNQNLRLHRLGGSSRLIATRPSFNVGPRIIRNLTLESAILQQTQANYNVQHLQETDIDLQNQHNLSFFGYQNITEPNEIYHQTLVRSLSHEPSTVISNTVSNVSSLASENSTLSITDSEFLYLPPPPGVLPNAPVFQNNQSELRPVELFETTLPSETSNIEDLGLQIPSENWRLNFTKIFDNSQNRNTPDSGGGGLLPPQFNKLTGFSDGFNGPEQNLFFFILLYSFLLWILIQTALFFQKSLNYQKNKILNRPYIKKSIQSLSKFWTSVGLFLLHLISKILALRGGTKLIRQVVPVLTNDLIQTARTLCFPLFQLLFLAGSLGALSVIAIKVLKWLCQYLEPQLATLTSHFMKNIFLDNCTNPSLQFIEITFKCWICSIIISRIIFNLQKIALIHFEQKESVLTHCLYIGSLVLFFIYFHRSPFLLQKCSYLIFKNVHPLVECQIGRIGLILCGTYSLNLSHYLFPHSQFIFLLYGCILKIYILALNATPNFF